MSENRKNHLNIDGGKVKQDDNAATYKPIPESDTDFRTSKTSITKSKEKLSADGAEEKLLLKEEEAKIITLVDMADAKYIVGDHRNGDAKIEVDANKRQFTGLTKEELMKYAEDPFWVRLRWFMFILFWAMWFAMLAAAIGIIISTEKCYPPPPRTWYEKGPLVDVSFIHDYAEIEAELTSMKDTNVAGIFMNPCRYDTYTELDDGPGCLDKFKDLAVKAKDAGVKVIVDLCANFVAKTHKWFELSENRSAEYNNYFIWAKPPGDGEPPLNDHEWRMSAKRGEYYLAQFGEDQPDLNFNNSEVVKKFDSVIKAWMDAGAFGIRLVGARQLVVNISLTESGRTPDPDSPALESLLNRWAQMAKRGDDETVFTLAEKENSEELFLSSSVNTSALRPPSAAPLRLRAAAAAEPLSRRLPHLRQKEKEKERWPLLQLLDEEDMELELAKFAMLLPATPVLSLRQLKQIKLNNKTSDLFADLVKLRSDASIEQGEFVVKSLTVENSTQELLACARWKKSHTGYAVVLNRGPESRVALTLPAVPPGLTTHPGSGAAVARDNVTVSEKSTLILSYVPISADDE